MTQPLPIYCLLLVLPPTKRHSRNHPLGKHHQGGPVAGHTLVDHLGEAVGHTGGAEPERAARRFCRITTKQEIRLGDLELPWGVSMLGRLLFTAEL